MSLLPLAISTTLEIPYCFASLHCTSYQPLTALSVLRMGRKGTFSAVEGAENTPNRAIGITGEFGTTTKWMP